MLTTTPPKRFIPVQKDQLRVGPARWADVLNRLNDALLEDQVTRPDISLADMLAGPHIASFTFMLANSSGAVLPLMELIQGPDLTPILSASAVQETWQQLRWTRGGRVIYDLHAALARAFHQTDVHVLGSDLVFPVPTFYLAVPPDLGLTLWNEESGEHVLDGFYVSEATHTELPAEQQDDPRGTVCVLPRGQLYTVPSGRNRALSVLAQAHPRPGQSLNDSAHVHFSIPLNPVTLPDGTLITDLESWMTTHNRLSAGGYGGDIGPNEGRMWSWCRLILNACLYLTSDTPDVEKRRFITDAARAHANKLSGRAKSRHLDELTRKDVRYSVLGSKFKTMTPDVPTGSESDRQVHARFIVRGHWRNQPHGEKMALRKRMWIQPHWKGPAWADIVARVQTIKPEDPVTP